MTRYEQWLMGVGDEDYDPSEEAALYIGTPTEQTPNPDEGVPTDLECECGCNFLRGPHAPNCPWLHQ